MQPHLIKIDTTAIKLFGVKRRRVAAIQVIAPAVVGTGETFNMALVGLADHHAAVGATVVEDRNFSVVIANHDHRIGAHIAGYIISGFRDFTFQTDEHPGLGEDLLHLKFKQLLIDIKPAAGKSLIGVDQVCCLAGC